MGNRKTYGQFCAVARALDRLGDRWTLLVVRELLLGPCSFRELQQALEGISPNLLVERLRLLRVQGLVERNDAPARSKNVTYSLTEQGTNLEAVVFELIRFGARYMATGPGPDRSDPRWAMLALRALLDTPRSPSRNRGSLHLDIEGQLLTITGDGETRRVIPGHRGTPDATMTATMSDVLAVASGMRPWNDLLADTEGDPAVLEAALSHGAGTH